MRARLERHWQPDDLNHLIRDPHIIKAATDLATNSTIRRADARTKGADGFRAVDLHRQTTHEGRAARVAMLMALPIDEFTRAMPELKLKTINSGDHPYGPTSDPIAHFFLEEEEHTSSGKERVIAIPTAWGDCLYRVFDEALTRVFDPVLPDTAVAYRRGRKDPVHGVLWAVQGAIRGGARYYAVLDIRSFFPSMKHSQVESALGKLGAPMSFIERLMASIQVSTVDERGARSRVREGCPPGLRISGTIANIYLRELDILIEKRFPRVLHRRYCDDIFLGGPHRHEVVGAVRLVRRWLQNLGHQVKGVGLRQSADSLVHDIEKRPLDVLGARVTWKGNIVLPPRKIGALKAKLSHQLSLARRVGPIIAGVSNYSGWDGPRGRYAFDLSDIEALLEQIDGYWGLLNGPYITDFLADLRQELRVPPPSSREGLSQTWAAWIPSRSRHLVGEFSRVHQVSADALSTLLTQLVQTHMPGAPSGPRHGVDDVAPFPRGYYTIPPNGDVTDEDAHDGEGLRALYPSGSAHGGEGNQQNGLIEGGDDGQSHRRQSVASRLDFHPSKIRGIGKEKDHEGLDLSDLDGQVGFGGAQPGSGVFTSVDADQVEIVDITVVPSTVDRKSTIVAVHRPSEGSEWSETSSPLSEESALLEAVLLEVRRAQSRGVRTLMLRTPQWLPKHLVKATMRFHSVALFDRVERLHSEVAEGRTDVVLMQAQLRLAEIAKPATGLAITAK